MFLYILAIIAIVAIIVFLIGAISYVVFHGTKAAISEHKKGHIGVAVLIMIGVVLFLALVL